MGRHQVEDAKLLISVHREYLQVYQDMDEEQHAIQESFNQLDGTSGGKNGKGRGRGNRGGGGGNSWKGDSDANGGYSGEWKHDETDGHNGKNRAQAEDWQETQGRGGKGGQRRGGGGRGRKAAGK